MQCWADRSYSEWTKAFEYISLQNTFDKGDLFKFQRFSAASTWTIIKQRNIVIIVHNFDKFLLSVGHWNMFTIFVYKRNIFYQCSDINNEFHWTLCHRLKYRLLKGVNEWYKSCSDCVYIDVIFWFASIVQSCSFESSTLFDSWKLWRWTLKI